MCCKTYRLALLLMVVFTAGSLWAGDLQDLKLTVQNIETSVVITLADGRTLETTENQQLLITKVTGVLPDDTKIAVPIADFCVMINGKAISCLALGLERQNNTPTYYPADVLSNISTNGKKGDITKWLLAFAIPKDIDLTTLSFAIKAGDVTLPLPRTDQTPAQPDDLMGSFDLSKAQFTIVDYEFVKKVTGFGGELSTADPDKYRLLTATLQITKPAGQAITLSPRDLTMHYQYGKEIGVARCCALSWAFYTDKKCDGPLLLLADVIGIKEIITTGEATTKAGTIFVKATFISFEPDTSGIQLCIAQPSSAKLALSGWK